MLIFPGVSVLIESADYLIQYFFTIKNLDRKNLRI
jgi:hypothetical protein